MWVVIVDKGYAKIRVFCFETSREAYLYALELSKLGAIVETRYE